MAMFDLLLERPNCQQPIPYVPSNGYDEECEDPMNEPTVALPTLAARYHVFDDLLPPAEAEGDLNPLGTIIYRSRCIAVAEESAIETPNTPKVRTPLEGEVRVPRVVDLKLMTCLATIVDFYGCHEVVKIFSEAWYKNICTEFEDEYSRQTLMWLSVSWVFPNQEPFDRATQTILKHMDGRSQLSTDHLPIPGVLPKIDDKRQELIGKVVTGLHDLLGTLPNSDFLCDWHKYQSPTCSSIALGILKRELQRLASSDRPLVPPFNGYSVMSMIQLVNDMPESIAVTTEEYDHYHDVSACSVGARMRRFLGDVKAEMNSWTLDLNMNVGGD
ncbi:hypothetical protein RAB80_001767 [Fusarium oxysporum f. sp. vasinfectum]|nr:hypothetical protein RAB80_001767 [Fusarium oxysporum f. sp. vasinfectum]